MNLVFKTSIPCMNQHAQNTILVCKCTLYIIILPRDSYHSTGNEAGRLIARAFTRHPLARRSFISVVSLMLSYTNL